MTASEPTTVRTPDGTTLCWQSLGDPRHPGVVLLGGATWSMDWWEDGFCRELVARGRHVVRYDARDTGESTQWPAGEPGYGPLDLADDVLVVADAAGLERFTPVGLSMGGGLAQRVAATHRDRVDGLVLMATSSAGETVEGLAPPTAELMASFEDPPPDPDWSDPDAVVAAVVAGERAFAGPDAWDPERLTALVRRVVARTPDMAASVTNHPIVAAADAPAVRLGDLAGLPTLVVHGDADPLFPGHGAVLAVALGAAYVELPGVGHQLPPERDWARVADAIADLTGGR